jgi:molybdenum cofactor guanylyltransferase
MLDDAELLRDPVLAALDPDLDSVLNVNTPADYAAARARPARGSASTMSPQSGRN